ncbi:MAG TPA: ABC transporter ATP-binding protein [Amycolatopsis sp.]|uniref:ABC transporter ATP-binding protein n=1 Tax=Amycolatopsis sp. TaxID=37632 RepID=UPI002B48022C|nr:ABC transporter ATP-binding protein [Amycolatopsis sp.]HKS47149.1 ABC transporter ATP-binding protein [Amycolatopsis sp.]
MKNLYRAALAVLLPQRSTLASGCALGLVSTAIVLSQPMLIGSVVGKVTGNQPATSTILLLIAVFAVDLVVAGLETYLLARAGVSLVFGTRGILVRKLLRAPVWVHLGKRRGDLFTGTVGDTDMLRTSLTQPIANMIAGATMVLGSVVLMLIIDPVLTGCTLLGVAVATSLNVLGARFVRRAMVDAREHVGRFGASLERVLSALPTVKVSRAEDREEQRVLAHARDAYRASLRGARLEAGLAPLATLAVQGSFAIVFTAGAYRMANGALSAAAFAAYLLYLLYLIAPLVTVFMSIGQLQLGLAAVGRVTAIASLPDERNDRREPETQPVLAATGPVLKFDRVSFGYPDRGPVLTDVSFEIPRRGVTALVGPSGIGKTTVFALLTQFWPGYSGRIELNGVDIRTLPLDSVRRKIGYVEQDAPALQGTILDNLRYAAPDASPSQISEAIELTGLSEWIDSLEHGVETQIGDGGAAISGGQRQRIAIARMLLAEPEVLLLDEVTSQLDSDTEHALLASLVELGQRCAVVAIAHRNSTIAGADRVIALSSEGCLLKGAA